MGVLNIDGKNVKFLNDLKNFHDIARKMRLMIILKIKSHKKPVLQPLSR